MSTSALNTLFSFITAIATCILALVGLKTSNVWQQELLSKSLARLISIKCNLELIARNYKIENIPNRDYAENLKYFADNNISEIMKLLEIFYEESKNGNALFIEDLADFVDEIFNLTAKFKNPSFLAENFNYNIQEDIEKIELQLNTLIEKLDKLIQEIKKDLKIKKYKINKK